MKKGISLLLAGILAVSLVACGGETGRQNEGASENNTEEYPVVGETISTDKAELTLNEFELTNYLYLGDDAERYLTPLTEEEAGQLPPEEEFGVAEDGKVFAYFSFTLKNIGKTPLDNFSVYENGNAHSIYMADYFQVDYDGYLFGFDNGSDIGVVYQFDSEDYEWNFATLDLDVLSSEETYRGYLAISSQALENTDKPILFNVQLPNENGDIEILTYKIR